MPFTRGDGLDKAEAVAEPEGFADTFVFLYRQIHDQLREEVSGLSKRALSWVPGPDTSSISTLVVHLLGSETGVLQIVRGPSERSRPFLRVLSACGGPRGTLEADPRCGSAS
jgi:hypothetical protein